MNRVAWKCSAATQLRIPTQSYQHTNLSKNKVRILTDATKPPV